MRDPAPGPGPRRTSNAEDLAFLGFGLWTLVGLCLDGWAHRHQPRLETFFTPWHAVFYAGFTGGAACLAWIVLRGRRSAPSLWGAVPVGYRPAVVGLGVFALGGVGDGIWHTVFGVESSIDALLSPTHLVMLGGMLAGSMAPFRAAWHTPDPGPGAPVSRQAFLPPLLSLTLATTAVAFFFLYANGFNDWPMTETLNRSNQSQVTAALGVLAVIVSTVVLLAPVLVSLQRWRPPFGAFTLLFTVVGVFMAGLDAFMNGWQVAPAVVGGLTADTVITVLAGRRLAAPRAVAVACGLVVPPVMWSVSVALIAWRWEVNWPPELWAGSVVMATLAGTALALLTHPAPIPDTRNQLRDPSAQRSNRVAGSTWSP